MTKITSQTRHNSKKNKTGRREYFIVPTKKQEELLKKTVELAMKFYDGSLRDNKFSYIQTA